MSANQTQAVRSVMVPPSNANRRPRLWTDTNTTHATHDQPTAAFDGAAAARTAAAPPHATKRSTASVDPTASRSDGCSSAGSPW